MVFLTLFSMELTNSFGQNLLPSAGPVGIGTLSPAQAFHVIGYTRQTNAGYNWESLISAGDGTMYIYDPDNSTYKMTIQKDGKIGIGTISPASKMDINGSIHTNGEARMGGGAFHISTDQSFVTTSQYSFRDAVGINNPSGASFVPTSSVMSLGNMYNGNSLVTTGNVGIGTTTPTEKLSVNGKIRAKEVKVETSLWPDYVFKPNYYLRSLHEVEEFIRLNKHLPEIPSASEVEKEGIKLGEMNSKLLQKIEELTLYVIELKRENEDQQRQLDYNSRKRRFK